MILFFFPNNTYIHSLGIIGVKRPKKKKEKKRPKKEKERGE
jgi:hypothetical protein